MTYNTIFGCECVWNRGQLLPKFAILVAKVMIYHGKLSRANNTQVLRRKDVALRMKKPPQVGVRVPNFDRSYRDIITYIINEGSMCTLA